MTYEVACLCLKTCTVNFVIISSGYCIFPLHIYVRVINRFECGVVFYDMERILPSVTLAKHGLPYFSSVRGVNFALKLMKVHQFYKIDKTEMQYTDISLKMIIVGFSLKVFNT